MNEQLTLITAQNVTKIFKTSAEELCILSGLNFTLEEGKRLAIMGQSGSGKTTLLSLLGGLDSVTSGSLRVGPYELSSLSDKDMDEFRSSFLGFVFQFHYLLKDFTALENIALPAIMRGIDKKKAYEHARELLNDVDLAARADHFPIELSGGERQRIAVARALINRPKLILADEPTGNLDPSHAQGIADMLFKISEKYATTLIMVTHDRSLARQADYHYELKAGGLVLV